MKRVNRTEMLLIDQIDLGLVEKVFDFADCIG